MEIITEDYVSFETAKFLKEKGFDWLCRAYITLDDEGHSCFIAIDNICKEDLLDLQYLCPTHQMAMKWLRKEHNIMVSPYALSLGYYFEIFDLTNRDITGCKPLYKVGIPSKEDVLPTYERACEVAINYCCEHFIR